MPDLLVPPSWLVGVFVDAFSSASPLAVVVVIGAIGMALIEAVAAVVVFVAWSGSEHA